MAIRDLKARLETQEGESGEALIKTLQKALNDVYVDSKGWQKFVGTQNKGVVTKDTDRLWEEAYKEILSESKTAVKAKKSDKAKEILGDLVSLTKDIAATEGVNVPIASGIQAMIEAVQPSIQQRIKTLKKGEGILKTMKKKAVASATGAVESFASGLLAPLPFGAGEAIIGKAKGVFGGGKKERRGEQAMAFASRLQEEGIETSGAGGESTGGGISKSSSVAKMGGTSENLEETNDILRDILKAVTPDREALEEAKRRKEMLRQEQRGGKVKFGDKGWMKSLMAGVMAGAMVVGAITAAVGALVMMVFDGITGYFKAEEWGVSKMNAVIGAVIGGTGSGMTGAMWGAAKWGGAGFAIGMVAGGPLGAIIGGAVGMLLGGIAGWFGGERIAKLLEKIENWFKRKWKALEVGLGFDSYTDEELKTELSMQRKETEERIQQIDKQLKDPRVQGSWLTTKNLQSEKEREQGKLATIKDKIKVAKELSGSGVDQGSGMTTADVTSDIKTLTGENTLSIFTTDIEEHKEELRNLESKKVFIMSPTHEYAKRIKGVEDAKQAYWDTIVPGEPKPDDHLDRLNEFNTVKQKWMNERYEAVKKVEEQEKLIRKEENRLIALQKAQETLKKENVKTQARGGIVTKPLYLPSSGIVVGEHPTASGLGDAQDRKTHEAIIPLDQRGIDVMRKATGADLNDAAMVTALRGGPGGRGFVNNNNVFDNSVINNNNTAIMSSNARGKRLPDEERIFG